MVMRLIILYVMGRKAPGSVEELFQLFFSIHAIDIKREATNESEITGPGVVLYLVMATCQGGRVVSVGDSWYLDHCQ
eukprot:10228921-Ditylum_brightwellii.AAC.1